MPKSHGILLYMQSHAFASRNTIDDLSIISKRLPLKYTMRFVQVGHSHKMNEEAFIRGCILFGIEYEKVDTVSDISGQPDLIWAPGFWIDPTLFPNTKFMFGPQFFVFPTKDGPLAIYNKESVADRCLYNCLSEWNLCIHSAFLSNPVVPYACLPFGVNTESMKPNPKVQKKKYILIYWKLRDSINMQHVVDILIKNKLLFKVVKYGFYKSDEYHKLLLESKLCIWLGRHESQGFAFQEALSYNVPLLVYDVLDMKEEVNDHNVSVYASYDRISLPATSAAFWDPICGEKTTNPKDIDPLLKKMMGSLDKYRPREFVERELSDKVCFKRVLDRFGFS